MVASQTQMILTLDNSENGPFLGLEVGMHQYAIAVDENKEIIGTFVCDELRMPSQRSFIRMVRSRLNGTSNSATLYCGTVNNDGFRLRFDSEPDTPDSHLDWGLGVLKQALEQQTLTKLDLEA